MKLESTKKLQKNKMKTKKPRATISFKTSQEAKDNALFIIQNKQKLTIQEYFETKLKELIKNGK